MGLLSSAAPPSGAQSRWDPRNYRNYHITVNITTYGPFYTKPGAILAAKFILLDCLRSGRDPSIAPFWTPNEPVYFEIYLREPPFTREELYREVVHRLDRIMEVSLSSGYAPLDNWERCQMRLSHELPET